MKPSCSDLRLSLLRNEAAISEIIPALLIRSSRLTGNQLGPHAVYMASLYPSEIGKITKFPFHNTTLPFAPRTACLNSDDTADRVGKQYFR
jgi:hypothetical protein